MSGAVMRTERKSVLVVEDDRALAELIRDELEAEGHAVRTAATLAEARAELARALPALVVSDLRLPDGNGMALVGELVERAAAPGGVDAARAGAQFDDSVPAIIVITAFGSVRQAVEALQAGADDFLTKPLDLDHFGLCVRRVLEARRLRDEVSRFRALSDDTGFHGIYGQSAPMRALFEQIRVIGRADGPVLVIGESGTGKELVARALHAESARAGQPFLAVNCAGIPPELLESEFFGHAAGAFTGARQARKGLLQEASGGTLLLDEIGEMPMALQAKLLRALQDGSIRAVGQDREARVDVRIIAATHRDLRQKVADGEFREDLYYRLETFSLVVPPLRDRAEDRELLAIRFLRELGIARGRDIDGFSDEALAMIEQYAFPGNVRELRNMVERAVAFCTDRVVRPAHLPERLREAGRVGVGAGSGAAAGVGGGAAIVGANAAGGPLALPADPDASALLAGAVLPTLDELQRRYLRLVLKRVGGNKRRAAALLGIGRRTLYRWLDEDPDDPATSESV